MVLPLNYGETGLFLPNIEDILVFVVEGDLQGGVLSVTCKKVIIFFDLFCEEYILGLDLFHP